MPDKINISGKELILNGLGIRKATWLRVKVYVAGLYLLKKSQDTKTIINMNYPKFINMHFVRSVGVDKITNGWDEGLAASMSKSSKEDIQKISFKMKLFNSYMTSLEKEDEIHLTFLKSGVKVQIPSKKKEGFIKGESFSKALLSIWFINAKDEGLRDGLLGL